MEALLSVLTSLFGALFSTAEGSQGIVVQLFEWLTTSPVLPFFGLGIVVSLVLLGIKVIRGLFWGL